MRRNIRKVRSIRSPLASNHPHSHDWFRYMAVNSSWSDIKLLQRCKMSSDVCLVERSRRKYKRHYFIKTMLRVPPPRVKQNLKNVLLGFLPEQETLLIPCTHLPQVTPYPQSAVDFSTLAETERRRGLGKGGFVHQDVLRVRFDQPQLLSWSWQCFQRDCVHMSVCMVKQRVQELRHPDPKHVI